jgi:hypothetical protein
MRKHLPPRWWIITQLNRLPGQCWSNLVSWALDRDRGKRSPWSPVDSVCRSDAAQNGTCYCGKLRADAEASDG